MCVWLLSIQGGLIDQMIFFSFFNATIVNVGLYLDYQIDHVFFNIPQILVEKALPALSFWKEYDRLKND